MSFKKYITELEAKIITIDIPIIVTGNDESNLKYCSSTCKYLTKNDDGDYCTLFAALLTHDGEFILRGKNCLEIGNRAKELNKAIKNEL